MACGQGPVLCLPVEKKPQRLRGMPGEAWPAPKGRLRGLLQCFWGESLRDGVEGAELSKTAEMTECLSSQNNGGMQRWDQRTVALLRSEQWGRGGVPSGKWK